MTIDQLDVPPMLPKGLVPYRVSVDQYAAMVARGIFTKQDRLELIEGMLVRKMTKERRHSRASENCRRAIERALPEGWHLEVEKPVRLPSRSSMPEPDLFVARSEVDDYEDLDPGPPDVALVVEVSDTTLAADRALAATYLNGGIPSYWIVNLSERTLEVYTAAGREILAEDTDVTLFVDDQPIARLRVADFLAGRKTE